MIGRNGVEILKFCIIVIFGFVFILGKGSCICLFVYVF